MTRLCLALVAVFLLLGGCTEEGAWDMFKRLGRDPWSYWDWQLRLTLDNSAQAETFSDFPVLVVLTPARVSYSRLGPGGRDLRFLDSDLNPLAHEVRSWSEGGTSYVWVNVPQVLGGNDTQYIWMYYGNGNSGTAEAPNGVWDTQFRGVWHLMGDVRDSTRHGNHGTDFGTVAATPNGRDFDGADYIRVSDSSSLDITGPLTMEAWTYRRSPSGSDAIVVSKYNKGTNERSFDLGFDRSSHNDRANMIISADGALNPNGILESPGPELRNTWYYVAGTYNGTELAIYVDGVQTNTRTPTQPGILASDQDVIIGGLQNGGSVEEYFDGLLAEVRLSATARSADWIAAQYLTMSDAFVTYGPEEQR
jgi:hypothetical protein